MNVREYLEKQKYHPAPRLAPASDWLSWYKGHVSSFHDYTIYNGQKMIKRTRASMQMAKKICEDWANLIMNEKVEITSSNEKFSAVLQEVLEANDFFFRTNQLIELTMALGTGALVEYQSSDGAILLDYIREEMIFPLSWDNGTITECAFASVRKVAGKKAYYINIHELDSGSYTVKNILIDDDGKEIPLPENIAPEVFTGSPIPRFQILMPNIVNNVDLDSPYGISVFANAIDRIKKCDLIFDSGNNEFALGRKRLILPITMAQIQVGEAMNKPVFDSNDVAFYGLNITGKEGEGQKPIDLTGELRIDAHSKGMQDALNYLSDGCGLGTDRYEYTRSGGVKTATEVISEKSALYQNLRKHELLIDQAIRRMVDAIADMAGFADIDVSVNFDDSIIQDTAAIMQQAMMEYNAGLIDEAEYFMQVYSLSEEEAKKKAEALNARKGSEGTVWPGEEDGEDMTEE